MPPASPAATRVLRMASRIEVLPWSTWPSTVTIGGRRLELARGPRWRARRAPRARWSTTSPSPSADSTATTSSLSTGSTVKPNSSATISAVAEVDDLVDGGDDLRGHQLLDDLDGARRRASRPGPSRTASAAGPTRRSPLASILTATEDGLKAERAASIAAGRQRRGGVARQPSLLEEVHQLFLADPKFAREFVCLHAELLIMPFWANSKPGVPSAPARREPRQAGGPGDVYASSSDHSSGGTWVPSARSRARRFLAFSRQAGSEWR